MITIKNTQRTIPVSTDTYKQKLSKILNYLEYSDFDLGVWFTTDNTIRTYNKTYRNKNKATDVLSFPYHPNLKPNEKISVAIPEDKNLGDIIISVPYVYHNKHNLTGTFEQRMDRMLVHGICHLLGHDHVDDKEFEQMQQLENKLLKIIA